MMNESDKEILKLVAMILGNLAAISGGIAIYERNPAAIILLLAFAIMAIQTLKGIR